MVLTVDGHAVDGPGDLGLGVSADSTIEDSRLVGGQDEVPGSADPERRGCKEKVSKSSCFSFMVMCALIQPQAAVMT